MNEKCTCSHWWIQAYLYVLHLWPDVCRDSRTQRSSQMRTLSSCQDTSLWAKKRKKPEQPSQEVRWRSSWSFLTSYQKTPSIFHQIWYQAPCASGQPSTRQATIGFAAALVQTKSFSILSRARPDSCRSNVPLKLRVLIHETKVESFMSLCRRALESTKGRDQDCKRSGTGNSLGCMHAFEFLVLMS